MGCNVPLFRSLDGVFGLAQRMMNKWADLPAEYFCSLIFFRKKKIMFRSLNNLIMFFILCSVS